MGRDWAAAMIPENVGLLQTWVRVEASQLGQSWDRREELPVQRWEVGLPGGCEKQQVLRQEVRGRGANRGCVPWRLWESETGLEASLHLAPGKSGSGEETRALISAPGRVSRGLASLQLRFAGAGYGKQLISASSGPP